MASASAGQRKKRRTMGSEREEPKTELVCNLRLRSCAHSVFLFYFCSFPNKLAAPKAADPPKIETKATAACRATRAVVSSGTK